MPFMKKTYIIGAIILCSLIAYHLKNSYNDATSTSSNKISLGNIKKSIVTPIEKFDSKTTQQEHKKNKGLNHSNINTNKSKLASYSGFGHNIEKDEETFTQEEIARESMIQNCMEAQGFEYTPAPSIVIDSETVDNIEEFERLLTEAANDPNKAYVDRLSDAKRVDYYLALTGMKDPNTPESQDQALAQYSDNCTKQAFDRIPSVYAKRNLLQAEYEQMEQDIATDPRILAANGRWADCMSDAQLNYRSPKELFSAADQAIARLLGQHASPIEVERARQKFHDAQQVAKKCSFAANVRETQKNVRIEHENNFVKENEKILNQ